MSSNDATPPHFEHLEFGIFPLNVFRSTDLYTPISSEWQSLQEKGTQTDSTDPPHVKFEIKLTCSTKAVEHSKNFNTVPFFSTDSKYLIQALTPTELMRVISLQFTCISEGGWPISWSKFAFSSMEPLICTTSTLPFSSFFTFTKSGPHQFVEFKGNVSENK